MTQERVSTTTFEGARFNSFVFLNTVQALGASLVAFLFLKFRHQKLDSLDPSLFSKFAQLTLLTTCSSPFGYASLKHIDYPTMILGKSCKLVPVMLMNFLLYRKTFPLYKYIVVAMITIGVSGFTLMQPAKKKVIYSNQ